MYCRKCGEQIPDDSNYCQYCGERVISASVVGNSTPKDSKWSISEFAKEFGKMQIIKAASCKGEYIRYALFVKETRVSIDERLKDVDASFIKTHKEELVVSQKGGDYVLSFLQE